MLDIDRGMIGQALTNLIKNAGEAVETLQETGAAPEGFAPDRGGDGRGEAALPSPSPTTAPACPRTGRGCSSPM
jgi:hypothetical protein